jgi:hypothetical protein
MRDVVRSGARTNGRNDQQDDDGSLHVRNTASIPPLWSTVSESSRRKGGIPPPPDDCAGPGEDNARNKRAGVGRRGQAGFIRKHLRNSYLEKYDGRVRCI